MGRLYIYRLLDVYGKMGNGKYICIIKQVSGQITNKFLNLNCLGILARIPLLFSTIGGEKIPLFASLDGGDGTYRSSHSSMIQWKNDHLGTHGPNFHDSGCKIPLEYG